MMYIYQYSFRPLPLYISAWKPLLARILLKSTNHRLPKMIQNHLKRHREYCFGIFRRKFKPRCTVTRFLSPFVVDSTINRRQIGFISLLRLQKLFAISDHPADHICFKLAPLHETIQFQINTYRVDFKTTLTEK